MDAKRPRIAMVADRRRASFGAWRDVDLVSVWSHYVEAVEAAGGVAIVVPATESIEREPDLALTAIDGLLLTGGRDIEAATYGADPDRNNEPGDAQRDRVELGVASAALERDLPVLGVCRGMQLLNLVLGGGIDQHLEDPDRLHRADPGSFVDHPVAAVDGSMLASVIGPDPVDVRSHHHQGVEPVAPGLVVSATSPDGLVEALEAPDRAFCLAVLWHPEENLAGGGDRLYEALVDAARRAAATA